MSDDFFIGDEIWVFSLGVPEETGEEEIGMTKGKIFSITITKAGDKNYFISNPEGRSWKVSEKYGDRLFKTKEELQEFLIKEWVG